MLASALFLGAFAAFASAQSQQPASSVLILTHVPNPVTDGQPQALTWSTNDTSSPVTLTLRNGNPRNLQTVQVLTTDASDGQYIWTPCSALPNGNDYVLQISQQDQVNYYGPFVVQGASASGTCSGISSTASATSSSTSGSARSTASQTSSVARNATITTSSSASIGTGTTMQRNTTMSSATLSRTITSSVTTTATTTSTNSGAGFQSTSASPSPSGGAAPDMRGSSVALVLGAVAAVLLG